jgi:hypothetical protein
MTMNYERRRAVNQTRDFLTDLLDPKKTPRVPKAIRQEASRMLKHFPQDYDMEIAAEQAPGVFGDWGIK